MQLSLAVLWSARDKRCMGHHLWENVERYNKAAGLGLRYNRNG
jgi:hypothetical protein